MPFESPPFSRGEVGTAYSAFNTVDAAGNSQLEGLEFEFPDKDYSLAGTAPDRSNRAVRCRIVRNKSGAAILAKKAVKPLAGAAAKDVNNQAGGYAALGDHVLGLADEFLPAAGAADGDLFYVVVKGPAKAITDSAGDTNFAQSVKLVPGGGTAGNLVEQNTGVAAGAATFAQVNSAVGRAMEAVNATATDVLVDVGA